MRILSEDQVRDKAREILQFHDDDKAFSNTGQLTSFNTLGKYFRSNPWKGENHKPDGWYLPKDKSMPCLLLEAKASDKDLVSVAEDEIKRNMKIALKRYPNVMGITAHSKRQKQSLLSSTLISGVSLKSVIGLIFVRQSIQRKMAKF